MVLVANSKIALWLPSENLVDDQVYKVELESGEQGYATGTKFKIISEPSRNLISIGVICW